MIASPRGGLSRFRTVHRDGSWRKPVDVNVIAMLDLVGSEPSYPRPRIADPPLALIIHAGSWLPLTARSAVQMARDFTVRV